MFPRHVAEFVDSRGYEDVIDLLDDCTNKDVVCEIFSLYVPIVAAKEFGQDFDAIMYKVDTGAMSIPHLMFRTKAGCTMQMVEHIAHVYARKSRHTERDKTISRQGAPVAQQKTDSSATQGSTLPQQK